MRRSLIIAGAALNQTPIDWEHNKANIIEAIRQAKEKNVDILCLPELCLTGYGCEDLFLSDWIYEDALAHLNDILPHCQSIFTCIGVPINYESENYNAIAVINDSKVVGIYCKQILANSGVHYEYRWFKPWVEKEIKTTSIFGYDIPIGAIDLKFEGYKIGFEICEDAWWPYDRPAHEYAEKNIDIILNPSASHFAFGKTDVREDLVIEGSKIINGVYVYANLLGNESGRMIYDGEIMIAQKGNMVQMNDRLSFKDINLLATEINLDQPEKTTIGQLKHYKDIPEVEYYEAVSLGMFDYMRKSHSNGFVLSLSGGADSACCATMVAAMVKRGCAELGVNAFLEKSGCFSVEEVNTINQLLTISKQEKAILSKLLITVYQSTVNSGEATLNSAKSLADDIGATFYHWSIDDNVKAYIANTEKVLERKLTWEQDDITLQNIQARTRSPGVWMLANERRALLLATANRSEADVGYATMDGDTSGGLSPIAGVSKAFILKWLKWAEIELAINGLTAVNNLQPSAELRPKDQLQTDEKDLMPYPILEQIERLAIKQRLSPSQVKEALIKKHSDYTIEELTNFVEKFFRLWRINQWKRERFAPSFHLDDFSVDPKSWCRYPILYG